MTSTENNVSETPNLKIFWGTDTPIPRHKPRALCSRDNDPRYKKTSFSQGYGPVIKRQSLTSGAPNENIVQKHINIALLNVL